MLLGGMPQAIDTYVKSKDFEKVDKTKKNILTLYRADVSKYAEGYENRVLSIFDEIPSQLSKKEKKFVLSSISKNARQRNYNDAFMWLSDAMIINNCFNSSDPSVGLNLNRDLLTNKCYMADTGLLISLAFFNQDYMDNDLYKAILFDKIEINEGMLMKNIVAQMLRAKGYRLFFYSRRDLQNSKNTMEIDFLIIKNNKVCPIEVKSSNYNSHSSLDKFKEKFKSKIGDNFIVYTKDFKIENNITYLPIYMTMFL